MTEEAVFVGVGGVQFDFRYIVLVRHFGCCCLMPLEKLPLFIVFSCDAFAFFVFVFV